VASYTIGHTRETQAEVIDQLKVDSLDGHRASLFAIATTMISNGEFPAVHGQLKHSLRDARGSKRADSSERYHSTVSFM
jgi:hypothetical protein